MLIAGCGTGQHAIETAQRFAGARVLAIDLSRTSLGYAARKSREARLAQYRVCAGRHPQSRLARPRRFDVIEASGVLHHLTTPRKAGACWCRCCGPAAFMHIGLYSALARADIRAARAFIAERGYGDTAADIRRCRQELLSFEDWHPRSRTSPRYGDFFTTSECRDLLFHVQEHQLTIPQIKEFLEDNGLTFLGFTGPLRAGLSRTLPERSCDDRSRPLARVRDRTPDAFVNMYQFWVQKIG